MKKNHIKLEQAINNAIQLCGIDAHLQNSKRLLKQALSAVQDVSKQRTKKQNQLNQMSELAKLNHKKWWDSLIENAKKTNLENLNEPNNDVT